MPHKFAISTYKGIILLAGCTKILTRKTFRDFPLDSEKRTRYNKKRKWERNPV